MGRQHGFEAYQIPWVISFLVKDSHMRVDHVKELGTILIMRRGDHDLPEQDSEAYYSLPCRPRRPHLGADVWITSVYLSKAEHLCHF